MIAYSGSSDTTADSSIFVYSNTATTDICSAWPVEKIEEDLVQDIQRDKWGDWRKYLKFLWFVVLRKRQVNPGQYPECKLCCRRQMLSFSGWIARAGYRKKKN